MIKCGEALEVLSKLKYMEECNSTKDGKCSRCGGCCGCLLPVKNSEIKKIHDYVKKHGINPYEAKQGPFKNPIRSMMCPFHHLEEKYCMIYEIRPKICRIFICDEKLRPKIPADMHKGNMVLIDMQSEFAQT